MCLNIYICTFTVFILHTSDAVVGLERTLYNFPEDVGVVEVCAIVYSPTIFCPIEFPFDVSLSTSDNTAGMVCSISTALLCVTCFTLHIHRGTHGLHWTLKDLDFSCM